MRLRFVSILIVCLTTHFGAVARVKSIPDTNKIVCYLAGKTPGVLSINSVLKNPVITTNVRGLQIISFSYDKHISCSDQYLIGLKQIGNRLAIDSSSGEFELYIFLESITFKYNNVTYTCKVHSSWTIERRQGNCYVSSPGSQEKNLKLNEQPDDTDPLDAK
jgi:hypothetical protein